MNGDKRQLCGVQVAGGKPLGGIYLVTDELGVDVFHSSIIVGRKCTRGIRRRSM